MNLVRLSLIIGLCLIAAYAISVYAAMPTDQIAYKELEVKAICPVPSSSGVGMVIVATASIAGALTVAATDLVRRVY
jgi:hypothetical protein